MNIIFYARLNDHVAHAPSGGNFLVLHMHSQGKDNELQIKVNLVKYAASQRGYRRQDACYFLPD